MQGNLAVRVAVQFPEIIGCRGIRDVPGPGVGHMEPCPLDGRTTDAVQLVNRQRGRPVVLEHGAPYRAGNQADGLHPVRLILRQIVGRGDGDLRNLVGSRFHTL